MTLISRRNLLWLAAAGIGCLCLVLLLRPARPGADAPDLRITGQPQMTNGAMVITFVLSNGTSRTQNIVEDPAGNPFVLVETQSPNNPAIISAVALTAVGRTLKLNLAPGASLTNALRLTNPPPRFRFIVQARDLSAERRRALIELPRLLLARLTHSRQPPLSTIPLIRSPWIENGSISNSTQNFPERLKETPTNGLSQ